MYQQFARIYDQVMRQVDYPTWAEYILNLALKFGFDTRRVCDLACGTGSLALLLTRKDCKVVGVDGSAAMLREAARKACEAGLSGTRWIEADLTQYGPGALQAFGRRHALKKHHKFNVFQCREHRDKVVGLEHKSNLLETQSGKLALTHPVQGLPFHLHGA